MKQGTILGSQMGRWIILAALVVVLGALLLTTRPVGAQTDSVKSYPENGTGRVASYSTSISGGGHVYWYLGGDDAEYFTLSRTKGASTVLNFKKPPNYEMPRGMAPTADNTNVYEVTVLAGDGGGENDEEFMVEVTVTDVDEPGSVTLTPIQPQTGIPMTAEVEDPDDEGTVVYTWAKSRSKTSGYTTIPGATGNEMVMYTPKKDDKDHFIMVTAKYIGASVTARSEYAVRGTPADNKQPIFFDQTPGGAEDNNDTAASFVDSEDIITTRSVAENTPPGTPIGPPVTAYDPDGEMLTYKLVDEDGGDDGDSTNFRINPRTGQIMTKADLQSDGTDPTCTSNTCTVKVVATDPSQLDTDDETSPNVVTSVTVTINVTNVGEDPMVVAATDTNGLDAMTVTEFTGGTASYALRTNVVEHTYTATDPEDTTPPTPSSVEGPDGKLFVAPEGVLAFKDCSPNVSPAVTSGCPNYEEPMDDGKDNVYEVDIVATDSTLNKGMRRVTIKVSNVDEDGKVTFPETVQPAQGESITAKLTDPDGEKSVTWQWTIAGASGLPGADPVVPATEDGNVGTGATYTPKAGDVGGTLTATASYADGEGSGKSQNDTTVAVLEADSGNTAPRFIDGSTPVKQVKSATLSVDENVDPPVAATLTALTVTSGTATLPTSTQITVTDADGQIVRYSVEGADKAMFNAAAIDDTDNNGERTVAITPKKELDHEAKSPLKITLRATDPFGQSATITVTINVTDAPEEPKITGPKTVVPYAENGKGTVANFTAKDQDEGARINWDLVETAAGPDHARFTINALDGVLTFKDSPNYEMPMDAGGGTPAATATDNIYEVTVRATTVGVAADNMPTKTQLVKVKVTDVPEEPEFAKSTDTLTVEENTKPDMAIGKPVTAMDPDTDPEHPDTTAPYFGVDQPTYSLSGADVASFSIVPATGQIVTKAKLDYEMKKSYMVTVTATDRSGGTDTIAITIEVLNVDEIGDIVEGDLIVIGSASKAYAENGTNAVATYTAEGEKAAMATWTLEGDDAGYFRPSSSSGMSTMLMFRSSPNYEMPMDADTDNTYMVTVKASYGSGDEMVMDTQDVTVMVTDANDDGAVTLMPTSPKVGDVVTAKLEDPDGVTGTTTWEWTIDGANIGGATSDSYTVADSDASKSLMATATYTDAVFGSQTASSAAVMIMAADPILAEHDADGNGMIDRSEAIAALRAYQSGDPSVDRSEAIQVLRRYQMDNNG